MTVKELIADLETMPEDLEVIITDPEMEYMGGLRAVYLTDTSDDSDRMPTSGNKATGVALLCDSNFSDLHD
jgi:hypothetical protein